MSKHITANWTSSTQQTSFSRAARLAGCLKVGKQQLADMGKIPKREGIMWTRLESVYLGREHVETKNSPKF